MLFRFYLFLVLLFSFQYAFSQQPAPCVGTPQMSSFCADACVICDIDGFTGTNDLTAQGQGFPEFCTTVYNNMQYIAFIAGSEDISIRVDVTNCVGGNQSLEVGFFKSDDCENFTAITGCDTDILSGVSEVFNNTEPLIIGQYYYLIMDGSNGANCDWTFNVLSGSTEVLPLSTSGQITAVPEICPGTATPFTTTGEVGAALYFWSIDGVVQPGVNQTNNLTFTEEGVFEVCVTAANVCDEAPPSCTMINVRAIEDNNIVERICEGDSLMVNGQVYTETDFYVDIFTYPNGCDSTITIDLTVLPQAVTNPDVWICNTDSFLIGDTSYNTTGSYAGVVLTADECDSLVNLELLVIECEILATTEEIPVICKGDNTGTLIFSVDQGTPPLTFTYTNIFDVSITGTGTTDLLVNNEIPNIGVGTYRIYITDDFGNDVVVTQEVTEPEFLEIDLVPSDYSGFNVSCFVTNGLPGDDGTLLAQITGGVPPYQYMWSDGQQDAQAIGLTHIEYMVTVTDDSGCTITASYEMTSPEELQAQFDFMDPTCEGDGTGIVSIMDIAGGVEPYEASLNNLNFSNELLFENLVAGTYESFIRDFFGCIISESNELTLPDIPDLTFEPSDTTIFLGDSIDFNPSLNPGTNVVEYNWSQDPTLDCIECPTPNAFPLNNNTYLLTVTSIDGCTDEAFINVDVEKRRRVFIPNSFSPNQDGTNDKFFVFGAGEVAGVARMQIFDRWGNKLYEVENVSAGDPTVGWDGTFKSRPLNPGLYVYNIEVLFIDGVNINYSGDFTLFE